MITITIRPWVPAWYRFRKSAEITVAGYERSTPVAGVGGRGGETGRADRASISAQDLGRR